MYARHASRTQVPTINRLPIELYQNIFRIVAEDSTSIRPIRLTCRYWRKVVEADRTLPRKISLRSGINCKYFHYPHDTQCDYCVHTLWGLVEALEFVQDARFHFLIEIEEPITKWGWEDVPWHLFEMQCTALFIHRISSVLHQAVANILENLPPLRSLEQISSFHTGMIFPSTFPTLVSAISVNSPTLRGLDWVPAGTPNFDLERFKPIFQNLRTLTLQSTPSIPVDFLVKLLSSFRRLEDFTWIVGWRARIDTGILRSQAQWRVRLQSLTVTSNILSAFPPSVLSELTVLTRRHGLGELKSRPRSGIKYERYHLPQLTHFTELGSWVGLVEVDAPNLQHLAITGYRGQSEYLALTTLNPTSIEIWDSGCGEELEVLFAQKSFTNLAKLSIKVEFRLAETTNDLVDLFTFHAESLSLSFPQLKTLDIHLYHSPGRIKEEQAVEQTKQVLSDVFSSHPYLVSIW
ncbi:hypothetical protein FRC17_005582 [Serendipita sp. 399]|nr:hypothetical protein FRC17_005582 [Serendipita sp. 399]